MLSIIVPIYKAEDTLQRCIRSVVSQSFNDWELILVDDGSPDMCPQMCDEWARSDVRIRVVHKTNGGLSDARNHGMDIARGEYITFLDSDDEYAADTLMPLMQEMLLHREYDILEYSIVWNKGDRTETVYSFPEHTYSTFEEYWSEGKGYLHCWAWNKVFRAPLLRDVRFKKGIIYEDVEFMGRLLLHKPTIHTTKLGMYLYYYNEGGISKQYDHTLRVLLQNQMDIVISHGIDLNQSRWHSLYMSMLNTQIDVYAITGEILLPDVKVEIRRYNTPISILKALMVRVMGVRATCRLFALLKRRGKVARTA